MTSHITIKPIKSIFSFTQSNILIGYIFMLYLIDALVVILSANGIEFYRLSLVVRSLFEFITFIYLLSNVKYYEATRGFIVFITLSLFCFIGNVYYSASNYNISFSDTYIAVNKYIFIFIAYPFMDLVFKNAPNGISTLKKVYKSIIYINSTIIFLALLLKIQLFKSYPDERFGYKGFIYAVNEATLFYFIALFFALYEYHKHKSGRFLLAIIIGANILLGTKAGMVFPFIILASYLLLFTGNNIRRMVIFFAVTLSIILIMVLIDFSNLSSFIPAFGYFQHFYDVSGFWPMLLSGRNYFIDERFFPVISNWSIANWLFGGTDINSYSIEMDFHDLFLLFGVIGSVFYILAYIRLFYIKTKLSYSFFFLFFLFLLAGLGGHVFYSSMNVIYLCIALLVMKYDANIITDSLKFKVRYE